MSWNYRVIADEHNMLYIHRVYYDDNGDIKAWSESPSYACGEDLEILSKDFEWMSEAFKKPILKQISETELIELKQ